MLLVYFLSTLDNYLSSYSDIMTHPSMKFKLQTALCVMGSFVQKDLLPEAKFEEPAARLRILNNEVA